MLPPHVAIVGIAGLVKTGIPGEDNQMSKPKVYLETSFIGYLTSRLSGDLITATHRERGYA